MGEGDSLKQTSELAATASAPLSEAVAIMERLRAPDGCPWDREQTFDTIKRHTLEETYEVFDAIERRDWPALQDELGDLLLQVLFYAQMAADAGHFTIADVARGLNAKLIRRHPHIFPSASGELAQAADAQAVLRNWDQIKLQEKQEKRTAAQGREATPHSALDDIPRTMPALLEAAKIGSRAAKAGFDWPHVNGLFAKLEEESEELQAEIAGPSVDPTKIEEELGDLLFTAVNLARHLKLDTESALRAANAKFRRRFATMEKEAGGYDTLATRSPDELDRLWRAAKTANDTPTPPPQE